MLSLASHANMDGFRLLQSKLRECWQTLEYFDPSERDVLVIPSLSLDQQEIQKVAGAHHYEERLLFSLIHLWNPKTRLIYITSQPIAPIVIDYYLQLLPGIPFSHARDRLILFSTYDSSNKPLTQKILERPRLIERIRQSLRATHSYMICYNSTNLERDLSLQLNVPLWGVDPDLLYWGTKSGSRQIFAECGIPHPDGSELVRSAEDLANAAADVWSRQSQPLQRLIIKLNEGFSGEGNAILNLSPIQNVEVKDRAKAIYEQFAFLKFQSHRDSWSYFADRIAELGAIAEVFLEGEDKRSPSVQGRISPNGEVAILSTHDQILGGIDNQVYLGCTFPAERSYRMQLQTMGLKIGENLAAKGALERYGVDFIAVQNASGNWDLHAIEINLRKGGTTHPFMTLRFLTRGRYNLSDGSFYSQKGQEKFYIATDNLQKSHYQGLLPTDLMDIIAHHRLHFDSSTETGTVFHLIGCLSEFGKLGLTSIGNSPQQAKDIYNHVINVLDEETKHH